MQEALQYLRGLRGPLHDPPLIAFVGHICRTWFVDEHVICAVMEILRQERLYRPVHIDPRGFDRTIKTIADLIGLVSVEVAPGGHDKVGRSVRDPEMLDGVAMVVAFPVEKAGERDEFGHPVKTANEQRPSWKTADPELAPIIEQMGLPVLAVYRDGGTTWVPGEQR
jgi:hypothetical protein